MNTHKFTFGKLLLFLAGLIVFIGLILFVLFFFFKIPVSIGSDIKSNLKKTDHGFSNSYELSSEEVIEKLTIKSGEAGSIQFSVATESGELTIFVKKGSDTVYEQHITGDFSDNITVESGNYTIIIQTKEHKGSYEVNWS